MSIEDKKQIQYFLESSYKRKKTKDKVIKNIYELTPDASSRKYYRLETESENYVVCLDDSLSIEEYYFLEVHKFLSKFNVRVPEIYDYDLTEGYLLEEDLGNDTLLRYSKMFNHANELKMYKKCVDLMVKIQLCRISEENDQYLFWKRSFNLDKLNFEIDFSIKHFFKFLLNDRYENFHGTIEEVRKELKHINSMIVEKKMVFTHRDFHSRNIMIKDDELVLIDFQDARQGIPQYDLVSLLEDCYYELDLANKEDIKKYYFGQLSEIVDDQKKYSDFLYFYDLICIQRTFKVLGTFSFIYQSKSNERYLKYISFGFEKLKKIMWKYDQFYNLRKNLSSIYYEH